VYRKCISGNLSSTTGTNQYTGITIPTTGSILLVSGTSSRGDYRFTIGIPGTAVEIFVVQTTGKVTAFISSTISSASDFCGKPYVCWVEYTKS
jgi:hypothetical protein